MWWVAASAPAFGTPPGPYFGGFAVDARTDAPTDARVLVRAGFAPPAEVLAGPNGGIDLAAELVAESLHEGLAAIDPPAGGWQPRGQYVVGVDRSGYATTRADVLEFGVGDEPAGDAVAPDVLRVTEQGVRVTVEVVNLDPDPWSYVALTGGDPGATLPVGVGPGRHTLSVDRDAELEPACFGVVGVAADGDAADGDDVCADRACACSSGRRVGAVWLGALVAVVVRRRT